jgi:hypothetical protein
MRRILERATTIPARGQRQQQAAWREDGMQLVDQRDLVDNVLEEVDRTNDADAAVL